MLKPVPKHILCPVDLTPHSQAVLNWAGYFARVFNSHVTILHSGFFEIPPLAEDSMIRVYGELITKQSQRLQSQLTQMVSEIFGEEVFWNAVFTEGHPVESILRWVEEHRVDLVVMGSHGRRGLARFLMGSVCENVTQHVSCPTLVVRANTDAPPKPERILFPLSTNYVTHESFDLAFLLASSFKGQLYFLSALDKFSEPGQQYREIENWLPEELKPQSQIFEIAKKGNTAEQIIHWARGHGVDLLVLGAVHRPFLEFTVLSSTALHLVRHSPCSVLLLPQAGRRSDRETAICELGTDRNSASASHRPSG